MLGLNSELESSCLPGQLRYIIHFLHAFDSDAVDLPLRPIANRFGGCFCLGSGPVFWVLFCFLLFASLFPLAKRKSGWGICGSSLFVWLWFSLFWFNRSADFKDFVSLYRVLAAYSHVRTEPLARHRPHSRKKTQMQHALKHVERPGGSHKALDGKKRLCFVILPSFVSWQQRLLALCGVFTLYTMLLVTSGSLVRPY